jgi:predicted MPP superfamily phosphohydrolase
LSLFLITFILLYGGLHLYAFLKVRATFSPGIILSIIICFFMVFMILAPMLVRMIEKEGLETLATGFAYGGYTWMAAILIFFVTGICTDIFRLIIYVSGALFGKNVSAITSANLVYFIICLVASIFVVIYGSFEARNIKTEYIVIKTKKISAEVGRVRIAQISDVHLGMVVGEERLKAIIKTIQQAKPDILVSTGDLLDAQPDKVEIYIGLIKEIYTPYEKFAVTGNHEVYLDRQYKKDKDNKDWSAKLTSKAGFVLLDKDVRNMKGILNIVGVGDEAGGGFRRGDNTNEESLCSKIEPSQFTVLLKHRPVPYTGTLCTYDLQLSGHTHKGQIFPFFFITRLFFQHYAGLYELSNKTYLYVSRGSGTWGPPIRFLAPPEVTIIDLVHRSN